MVVSRQARRYTIRNSPELCSQLGSEMCIPFIRSATSVGVIPEPLWCVRHVQGFRVVGLRSGLESSVIRGHDGRVFFFRPQLAQKCLACATKSAMEEQRHGSRSLQEGHDVSFSWCDRPPHNIR